MPSIQIKHLRGTLIGGITKRGVYTRLMSTDFVADEGEKECRIRCNWCLKEFRYLTVNGQVHNRTSCPDCGEACHVPKNRLRRLNGVHPHRVTQI